MELKLTGLTALVTGASRGIGFAVAQGHHHQCHWRGGGKAAPGLHRRHDRECGPDGIYPYAGRKSSRRQASVLIDLDAFNIQQNGKGNP